MKTLLLVAFLAMSSVLSTAQGVRCCVGLTVTTPTGAAVPNPAVRVCAEPASGISCTPLVPGGLFLDRGLTIPTTNPVIGDVNGNYPVFYVAPGGRLHLQITAPNITQVDMADVVIGDQSQLTLGVQALAFSATPVFDSSAASMFQMTLTGNVTSSTALAPIAGRVIGVSLCQDATGGRTFAWPANFLRPPVVAGKALSCTVATFYYDATITNWRQLAANGDNINALEYLGSTSLPVSSPTSIVVTIAPRDYILCRARITGYPAPGDIAQWQLNSDAVAADYQTRYIVFSNAVTPLLSSANYCSSGCTAAATGIPLGDAAIQVQRISELECINFATKNKVCNVRHAWESSSSLTFNSLSMGYAEWFNTTSQITSVNLQTLAGLNMFSGSGFMCFGKNF